MYYINLATRYIILLLLALLIPAVAIGQSDDLGSISGTVFGDYYWVMNHHLDQDPRDIEGANGFRFRRIYLTHEYDLGQSFSTRIRLEMEHSGNYLSASGMTPGVKDAYLKYKPGDHAFYLGISGTPTWDRVEKVWGYRSLEQTPLDLQGYGSSRDFGIAAKGPITEDGSVTYSAMIGNGAGTASEMNKGKKAMLSIGYQPDDQLILEIYGDYNNRPGPSEWSTIQAFAAYQTDQLTLGGVYAYQFRSNVDNQSLLSAFTHFQLNNTLRGIFRIDHSFEANPAGPNIDYLPLALAESTILLAGVDMQPVEDVNVHIMPNVKTVFYNENTTSNTPDTDMIGQITFSYGF